MKKSILWMTAVSVLLLAGCGQNKSDTSGYQVYYINEDENALVSTGYTLKGENTLECIQDMWKKMTESVPGSSQGSLVPEGLEIQELDLTDGQLTMTFNTEYNKMNKVREVLLRAGIVEGVTQFTDVKTVVFHVGEDVLRDHNGEPIGAMTRSSFINNPVGINSYQYASLVLYFSSLTGDKIVKEMRNVHYSTNTTLEKVILEQLIAGPMNSKLGGILSEDIRVLDVKISEKTCTLNLNQAFMDTYVNTVKPEVVIYAMVDSLCDNLGVDKVQFQVEGNSDIIYGDSLSLAGPFHRNSDIIETKEQVTEAVEGESQELGEPQVGL